jgi:NitT/TauT family transport system substrate-binding protein
VIWSIVLAGCTAAPPQPEVPDPVAPAPKEKDAVTIALNWYAEPEFGGLYQAQLDGSYAAKDLEVTIQPGGAGAPVIPQVATGRVQFGISMADEVVLAKAQGADIVTVFATYQTHPLGIMVHASRGLKDLADLKSGTLAVEDGIPFAQFLFAKYDWKGVTRVPYGGGVTQFLLDKDYAQQVYVTSEPILAKKQGADPQVFMVADTGYNPYANVLVTSGKLVAENPGLVDRFVDATSAGWRAYLVDGTAANAKIHEVNPTMDADVLQGSWEAQKPLITGGHAAEAGVGAMEGARWATLVEQLTTLGALKTPVDPESLYTNQFLDAPTK